MPDVTCVKSGSLDGGAAKPSYRRGILHSRQDLVTVRLSKERIRSQSSVDLQQIDCWGVISANRSVGRQECSYK